jgi:hypothetical protein
MVGFVATPADAVSADAVRVLANHLDNPRGLEVQGNTIYIAESGHGDPAMCLSGPVTTPPTPPTCVGLTGGVSVISSEPERLQTARRVVNGLISITDPTGSFATGPSAVSVEEGRLAIIMAGNTNGLPPSVPPNFQNLLKAVKAQLGQLILARKSGSFKPVLGVGDLDFAWSALHKNLVPDQFPDSNPNAVLAEDDVTYVVDAGANTLDTIKHGKIVKRVFFGVPAGSPTDSVPTCVSRGPDGALYVGELLGGNFAPGHARVWRVTSHSKKVWATGLTAVNGCGWGRDGRFYATEFQRNGLTEGPGDISGDVVRINSHGKILAHLGVGQLTVPSGFAAGHDDIYVSNCSIAPATGFGPCTNGGQLVAIGH